jgi:hypothetical protein
MVQQGCVALHPVEVEMYFGEKLTRHQYKLLSALAEDDAGVGLLEVAVGVVSVCSGVVM